MKDTTDTTTTINTNLGYIITSEAENQEINKTISIPNIQNVKQLKFPSGTISSPADSTIWKFIGEPNKQIKIDSKTELQLYSATKTYLQARP